MKRKSKFLSLDEYIERYSQPVKSDSNEIPIEQISRIFNEAIKKNPEQAEVIKEEWIKIKKRFYNGEISNLLFQIKEVLSKYKIAYLSENKDEKKDKKIDKGNKNGKEDENKKDEKDDKEVEVKKIKKKR